MAKYPEADGKFINRFISAPVMLQITEMVLVLWIPVYIQKKMT